MEAIKKLGNWIVNIALAFDRLANAVLLGSPEMTISGRMGRDLKNGRCIVCRPICWMLNIIRSNHCANAAANEGALGSDQISPE